MHDIGKYRPQTRSSLAGDGHKGPQEARRFVLPTCICKAVRAGPSRVNFIIHMRIAAARMFIAYNRILHQSSTSERHLTHLAVPQLWVLERIRLQHSPESSNPLFGLIPCIFRKTAMQILLNVFRTRACPPLVLLQQILVHARVRIPEEN